MDRMSYECLRGCISHHQQLLGLIAEMEEVLNIILFFQFFNSTGTICLIIFYITMNMDVKGIVDQLKFVQLLAVALAQVFLYCWFGNDLTYESDSLTKAIYDCPWYEAPIPFRKSVAIMLSRTMKPSYLTGGKLYVLSLETYRAIVGASFSYYTVLRNINT
ncbi:odorant receptor 10-like [Periplaneta americana]|uniref:odorant receptor 10-like n=1 Tax=Periplaneta americana TaxID=6978 RepID=UPI0037E91340